MTAQFAEMEVVFTTPNTAVITSQTDERKCYTVNFQDGTCECPQYQHRGNYCKHQDLVDDQLILRDKIPVKDCDLWDEDNFKHTNCKFQQMMLDRGYVMLDGYKWKKREYYDKMDPAKQPEIWLDGEPDFVHMHPNCGRPFHLFKQTDVTVSCHQAYCKEKIQLTDDEVESYQRMAEMGFIVTKFCPFHSRLHAIKHLRYREFLEKRYPQEVKKWGADWYSLAQKLIQEGRMLREDEDKIKAKILKQIKKEMPDNPKAKKLERIA